ncbi:MAG: hypothetical protein AB203_03160 [Parcubacteria bacterium C7867-008]|nr:MAG: hypothetical protein AB203_03160 [Parcubacteria bacterium C7867-008]
MALSEEQDVTLGRLEELLEENLKLAEDTNRILRDVRRTGRIAFWAKVILWTIVLVLPFFFIGPVLRALEPYTNGALPAGTTLLGVPSPEQIQSAVEQFKAKNTQ